MLTLHRRTFRLSATWSFSPPSGNVYKNYEILFDEADSIIDPSFIVEFMFLLITKLLKLAKLVILKGKIIGGIKLLKDIKYAIITAPFKLKSHIFSKIKKTFLK